MARLVQPFIVFPILLLALGGCTFFHDKTLSGDSLLNGSGVVDGAKISFQTVRQQVFAPNCISCHGNSGGVNLENYSSVIRNLARIEKAALIDKTMPRDRQLGGGESNLLNAWIQAGAPENPGGEAPPAPPTPDPNDPLIPTYGSIKRNIFEPRCLSCHREGGSGQDIPLWSLKGLLDSPRDLVLPGNPDESGLLISVIRPDYRRMPPLYSGSALTPQEVAVIRLWISLGAPEGDDPNHPPEPLESKFSSIRKNVFEMRCIGCHTLGGSANGVPLISYKDLLNSPRDLVLPGNADESGLMIALTRQDAKRMPPPRTGDGLPDSDIAIIRQWIQSGAKDDSLLR